MIKTKSYAAQSATSPLAPHEIERREPGADDVRIEILYCGVCHSDLHTARNEWTGTLYPCVPGHEIVGRVVAVGSQVTELQGRRPGGRRLHGRQLRPLPFLRRRRGAVLREWLHRHLQRPAVRRREHLRRLFPDRSWSRNPSFCMSGMTRRRWPASRRCCAPASPPTRRCATGAPGRAGRSASSAWAASATWASSSPMPWART